MKEKLKEMAKRLLGRWFFPEIAELEGRLKTTHQRMQEMYWDEKDKEFAKARIEGLEKALGQACNAFYGCGGSEDNVRTFAASVGVQWDPPAPGEPWATI